MKYQFYDMIGNLTPFKGLNSEINDLLGKAKLLFIEPENKIMRQHEPFDQIMMIGSGSSKAYKHLDSRNWLSLGPY